MTIEQTVEIPADHRLIIDVPREIPAGKAILSFTPVIAQRSDDTTAEMSAIETPSEGCPICAKLREPVTGKPRYNAETIAAIEEGKAMMRGEIPAKRFNSLEELLADLRS
jgi:hypothetical protein